VFVEGLDVSFYPSLDDLTQHLEAQDVRAGVGEAFDGLGHVVHLAAASDASPVTAEVGALASDRLRGRLVAYIDAIGPELIGIGEADLPTIDVASLVRTLSAYQRSERSSSW
jgi:hypothetical protein